LSSMRCSEPGHRAPVAIERDALPTELYLYLPVKTEPEINPIKNCLSILLHIFGTIALH
jgi:hypothetical protein